MSLPSFSAQNRISICPASGAGEQVDRVTTDATLGTWKHRTAQAFLEGRDIAAALADVPAEYRPACERVIEGLLALPFKPGEVACEVAFAYDTLLDEAREIGRGIERDYERNQPLEETEIPGTIDLVAVASDRSIAWADDFKFGFWAVARADRNRQLICAALAVSRCYRVPCVRVAIRYIGEDGNVRTDAAEFGKVELDRWAVVVAEENALVVLERQAYAEGRPPVRVISGAHCYAAGAPCPRIQSCTATTGLLRAAVANPTQWSLMSLSPPELADMVSKLDMLEALVKLARKELDVQATARPIDLGDGYVYGPVLAQSNEKIDGDIAREVLARLHGDDIASTATRYTATKKSIEAALRLVPREKGTTMKKLTDDTFEALRKSKGITSTPTTKLEVHRRDVPALPAKSEGAA